VNIAWYEIANTLFGNFGIRENNPANMKIVLDIIFIMFIIRVIDQEVNIWEQKRGSDFRNCNR